MAAVIIPAMIKDASKSIVWYPSLNPNTKAWVLVSSRFKLGSIGDIIPLMMRITRMVRSTGVRNFPIIFTTFEEESERIKVSVKKTIDDTNGFVCGKILCTPTSKVVAAVLGMAISGPMLNIHIEAITTLKIGCIRLPTSLKLSPETTTVIMPKKVAKTLVMANPDMEAIHDAPDSNPRIGGKIKFPAPKNMANKANPTMKLSSTLFLSIYYTVYF